MATSVRSREVLRWALVVVTAAGLVIDAYVHVHLASSYAGVATNVLSQADLFRVEGAVAAIAAAAVLFRPRRYTAAFAFVVAAGGTAAVVGYRYVDVGAFGPVPNMYEPVWYAEKTLSAVAEGIAAVAALALFGLLHAETRRAPVAATRSIDRTAPRARG